MREELGTQIAGREQNKSTLEISFGELPLLTGVESQLPGVPLVLQRSCSPGGAQGAEPFWAVPAAARILPACEQHPCAMGLTLTFLLFQDNWPPGVTARSNKPLPTNLCYLYLKSRNLIPNFLF